MNQHKPSTTSVVRARPMMSEAVSFAPRRLVSVFARRISRAIRKSGKVTLMAMTKPRMT